MRRPSAVIVTQGPRATSGRPRRPDHICWNDLARTGSLFDASAVEVRLDLQPRAAAEAGAVDLQILHDALHVVAGLGERNQLDPIDSVNAGIAGIAITLDPLFDAAAAGVVGRERHDVGAAVILE